MQARRLLTEQPGKVFETLKDAEAWLFAEPLSKAV